MQQLNHHLYFGLWPEAEDRALRGRNPSAAFRTLYRQAGQLLKKLPSCALPWRVETQCDKSTPPSFQERGKALGSSEDQSRRTNKVQTKRSKSLSVFSGQAHSRRILKSSGSCKSGTCDRTLPDTVRIAFHYCRSAPFWPRRKTLVSLFVDLFAFRQASTYQAREHLRSVTKPSSEHDLNKSQQRATNLSRFVGKPRWPPLLCDVSAARTGPGRLSAYSGFLMRM